MKNSTIKMMNKSGESVVSYDVHWIKKFLYPHGFCYLIPFNENPVFLHYVKLVILFTNISIGYELLVMDSQQISFTASLKSFSGHKVEYTAEDEQKYDIFNMELFEHQMDSKDQKAKCSDYGPQEQYRSFKHCFMDKVTRRIKAILGCAHL